MHAYTWIYLLFQSGSPIASTSFSLTALLNLISGICIEKRKNWNPNRRRRKERGEEIRSIPFSWSKLKKHRTHWFLRDEERRLGNDAIFVGSAQPEGCYELVVGRQRISGLARSYLPHPRCFIRNRFRHCCGTSFLRPLLLVLVLRLKLGYGLIWNRES